MACRYAKKIEHRDCIDQFLETEGHVTAKGERDPNEHNDSPEFRSRISFQEKRDGRKRDRCKSDIPNVLSIKRRPNVRHAKQLAITTADDVWRKERPEKAPWQTERSKEIVRSVGAQAVAQQFKRR